MAPDLKPHTQIDVRPQKSPFFLEAVEKLQQEPQRLSFFKSRSRRITRDTWVVSLFVLLQIVVFAATMVVNDCWTNSHGDCSVKLLGRLSFQPLSENPLFGPSASTLDEMGALRQTFLAKNHLSYRLFTSPWLHGGALHLAINLSSIILVGIYLEQEFGPLRIGMIYMLSAFVGSLLAAVFVQNRPTVCSSGALFGLLGAMLSALIRNWEFYSNKLAAVVLILMMCMLNFLVGLLPHVDNFSNIGGFMSGFLLGFAMLFRPQIRQGYEDKLGGYEKKSSVRLKEKLDRPVMRVISLLLFGILVGGCMVAVLEGINMNQYCKWCQYINCIPSKRWSCNDITSYCERMVSNTELTLTCMENGNFRIYPFTNITEARIEDLCTLVCS